jgi:glutamyl-tRNA reductase
MQTLVVGLNHKTAPIALLERLAIGEADLVKALHQLDTYEHVLEGAILSTCNRTEVYAEVSRFHGGALDLRNFLAEFCHVAPEEFSDHLYTYHEEAAVRHLFRVASGVDSMVIGESEILGQVRRSFKVAIAEGVARTVLSAAFRRAMETGKRARTETGIGRNPASISSAAVKLAHRAFPEGDLAGRRVAIVGAGKMGALAARALGDYGATDVVVVNRTPERGRELAARFGAEYLPFERLGEAIAGADIVLCSTTSTEVVIDAPLVEACTARRDASRPLLFVDIAVPRDVDPSVSRIPGVRLRDIDDLRSVVESSIGSRAAEVAAVEEIISAEVDRFVAWERSTEVAPVIAALVERGDQVRRRELERVAAALAHLSPDELDAVEQVTRRIVAKLLHDPMQAARNAAPSKGGHAYLSVLRDLFRLDP